MSAALTPFVFEGFAVRTIQAGGQLWFVASDVCSILDLGNISMACGRLDDDEKGISSVDTLFGGSQEMLTVNESGLYSLILTSRKPKAKAFKRWVTVEVLPTIRKTGSYSVQATPAIALPQDYIQALESLLASKKSEQLAIEQRDHAIATKAQISDKKTATAMATASHLKRENNKLKDELGFNTRHATVIAVEGASGASSVTVPCARYGKAQAWPSGAWQAVYGVDLVELFGEAA